MSSSSESNFLWTSASSDDGSDSSSSTDTNDKNILSSQKSTLKMEESLTKKKKNKNHSFTDTTTSKMKKSVNKSNISSDIVKMEDHVSDSESYLNLRIKQEQFDSQSERESEHRNSEVNFAEPQDITIKSEKKKKKKRKSSLCEPESDATSSFDVEQDESNSINQTVKVKKEKKGKKNKPFLGNSEYLVAQNGIDDSTNDEIVKKKSRNKDIEASDITDNDTSMECSDSGHKKKKKERKNKTKSTKDVKVMNGVTIEDQFSEEETRVEVPPHSLKYRSAKERFSSESNEGTNLDHSGSEHEEPLKQKKRLSERITFEDEEEDHSEGKTQGFMPKNIAALAKTQKLKPFQAGRAMSSAALTSEDDVWLLQCSQDVDISTLKVIDFVNDHKCKIKVHEQKYEAHLNEDIKNIAVTAVHSDAVCINNITIKGVYRFRKRIPKIKVNYDEIVMHEPTTFIPLPETKCRHPLFGPEYKEAIKIPKRVAERLLNGDDEEVPRKKLKKAKYVNEEMEQEVKTEPESVIIKQTNKKKKKRKHSTDEAHEPVEKKRRKIKNDPDSATWDSEKGIADTLFNF